MAGGLLSMMGAAAFSEEVDWEDSNYETTEINGIQYEMIPIQQEGDNITYKLFELKKTYKGGEGFVIVGAGLIIASYLYDYIHGIKVIEDKRDKVRFKYGKMKNFSFSPTYNMNSHTAGFNFTYNID